MRIAINGKSFGITEKGGAVRIAIQIVRHIALAEPDYSIDVIIPINRQLSHLPSFPENVKIILDESPLYSKGVFRSLWEQFKLPKLLKKQQPYDALLNLTNTASVLRTLSPPQLLLIHDAGFLNRQWFSMAFSWYLKTMLKIATYRNIHFSTVSQASADDIMSAIHLDQPVTVIPNGVDTPPENIDPSNMGFPFILFLGSINPRKNLTGAIEAFHKYKNKTNHDIQLVIAGAEKPIFKNEINDKNISNDIHYLGYISDSLKWSLINDAQLLLLPSFMEGFGLPIIEAFMVGTPVVASDIPVFHELFADIPEYVKPESSDDIAAGIEAVLNRSAKNNYKTEDGIKLCDSYSWTDVTDKYLRLLKRTVKE